MVSYLVGKWRQVLRQPCKQAAGRDQPAAGCHRHQRHGTQLRRLHPKWQPVRQQHFRGATNVGLSHKWGRQIGTHAHSNTVIC